MKLYFSPGACSLSPHIVLQEAELPHSLEKVDLRAKQTATGVDFWTINPKGYVPTLQLKDGSHLTEGVAIVLYLADQVPEKKLAPPEGTMERYHLIENLVFISTELHKNFSPLFTPSASDDSKQAALNALKRRFAFVETQLSKTDFLCGHQFTVADAYLFVMLTWTKSVKLSLEDWPALQSFKTRIAARPAVRAAMLAEGLIKADA
jgi:glutathione S-transferase